MATIPLTNADAVALIDDDDASWCAPFKWRLHQHGYVCGYMPKYRRSIMLHRWVMRSPVGRVPMYDHGDGDKLNNHKSNLVVREQTQSKQGENNDAV